MAAPTVSVVLPAKDSAGFLGTALRSLTRQFDDPRELEVVVVDDGSTDGTAEVAESFACELPGLVLLRQDEPLGVSAARNRGNAAATGRYLAYLDADDWLAPRHLPAQVDALRTLGCPWVRVDMIHATGLSRTLVRAYDPRRNVVLKARDAILPAQTPTMVNYAWLWAGMYDRAMVTDGLLDWDEDLRSAADRPIIWNLHLNGPEFAVVDAPGVFYRRGEESITQTLGRHTLHFVPAFEKAHAILLAAPDSERYAGKLVRDIMAVVWHHSTRVERMDDAMRTEFYARSAGLLKSFPRATVREQLLNMSRPRRQRMRDIMSGALA